MSATANLDITPVTTSIGAEISGLDLSKPLQQQDLDTVYQALIDHLVIFFRGQQVSPAQHQRFAESFGTLDEPHPVYAHVPGFEQIVQLANDANNPPDTDGWHTDLTFKANPPFASILIARQLPPTGGDTLWANMYAAYDALPEDMKQQLEGIHAIHDMGDFRNNFSVGEVNTARLNDAMQRFGCAIHPVVKTHPVSGNKYLYVNEGFTVHLIGQTARESRRLLGYLLDHIGRPEYQVRFRWSEGAMAMWDNRCTQHYAVSDYLPNYRCMNRITVVNDRRTVSSEQADSVTT